MGDMKWAALVPELTCLDLENSLNFYRDGLGFEIAYHRLPDFAYLRLGEVQLMLQAEHADTWRTGALDRPLGRGVNLQIEVSDAAALRDRLVGAGRPIFRDLATAWYRADDIEHGQREFLVQDPDGYLLRFCDVLGERPVRSG
jgi:catechol 2,3-dioxygenase-like lactoylglutathione lyase family enzyme